MNKLPINFTDFDRVWLLTWTTYATWLPGDNRGHVSPKFDRSVPEKRNNVLGDAFDGERPQLQNLARAKVIGEPIYLRMEHAILLQQQFIETAHYRGWRIVAGAIMSNHIHLLVGVANDPDPADLLRDFKSYGSRVLNKEFGKPPSETWWTEQGSRRKMKGPRHFEIACQYVHDQHKSLVVWNFEK